MDALSQLVAAPISALVYVAMSFYALGFVFKRQVVLRLLVIAGSAFYILYYYFQGEAPLWDAIVATIMIVTANLVGLLRLWLDRLPGRVRARDGGIYRALDALLPGALTPGQFRRLMRDARVVETERETRALELGRVPATLCFVERGSVTFRKAGRAAVVDGPRFVGDVAFVTGGIACDDAWIAPGSRVVTWPASTLRRRIAAEPALDRALHALLTRDMAEKIARSVELPQERRPANDRVAVAPGALRVA